MKIATFKDRTWTQINGGQHHTLALDNEGRYLSSMSSDVLVFYQQKTYVHILFSFGIFEVNVLLYLLLN